MRSTTSEDEAPPSDDMQPEYEVTEGIRGKHYLDYGQGHAVKMHVANGTTEVRYFTLEDGAVMLEPDVREYFPDSDAVNEALRGLIRLLPDRRTAVAEREPEYKAPTEEMSVRAHWQGAGLWNRWLRVQPPSSTQIPRASTPPATAGCWLVRTYTAHNEFFEPDLGQDSHG